MSKALKEKFTLTHLRQAREAGRKVAMLTCYDYSMARLMHYAGIPSLLVGDSAASVVLGHPTTLPVPLSFMIQITAAVRRGAPLAFLVADMPFGSYQASVSQGVKSVCRMIQQSGCDCVKLEVTAHHLPLVEALASAGVAVMGHIGLRPQSIGLMGGYTTQGKSADQACEIVALALQLQNAGACALLLEAVPPEIASAVVKRTNIPVIGCGAGSDCHGCVIVTHDGLGLTPSRPRFVPKLADLAEPMKEAFARYAQDVTSASYPAAEHNYSMPASELAEFKKKLDDGG
ncbi:MAG: 3-methyl-2-oxobutanoate hydroxymethyltransferase [Tepidisphaeraceae bacterium]|jgi:3-methyl-2-oxobutanoate hydroxymethyltransferase